VLASSAPPTLFETASGCSLSCLTCEVLSLARSSLGVQPFFRVLELRVRPGLPCRASPPLSREEAARLPGSTSPGVLSPFERLYAGCPFSPRRLSPRGGRGSPDPRRCRPQGSCPSRRFWLRSRCARTLARSAALRDAPTLRGLVPCRSRPWETPCRAFPSRGAVPALASLVLPCGFMVDRRRCDALGRFATAFPTAPGSLPTCQTWGLASDCGAVTEVSCGS